MLRPNTSHVFPYTYINTHLIWQYRQVSVRFQVAANKVTSVNNSQPTRNWAPRQMRPSRANLHVWMDNRALWTALDSLSLHTGRGGTCSCRRHIHPRAMGSRGPLSTTRNGDAAGGFQWASRVTSNTFRRCHIQAGSRHVPVPHVSALLGRAPPLSFRISQHC